MPYSHASLQSTSDSPIPSADLTCELPEHWRARAKDLRHFGAAEGAARAYELAAQELAEWLSDRGDRLLSPTEAAVLVGRHRDTIGNAIRAGRLTNHGAKHRPRVRLA